MVVVVFDYLVCFVLVFVCGCDVGVVVLCVLCIVVVYCYEIVFCDCVEEVVFGCM